MLSFISDSRFKALSYAKVVVAICLVFAVLLEGVSGYLLKKYSVTYRRVSGQITAAIAARSAVPGDAPSVVMVGNSLLMDGVQMGRLQQMMSSSLRIYPVFLEGTGYHDWFYGLRLLFREGARPQVVVLGLDVNSFLGNAVRPEYSPMMLFNARDVLRAGSDLGLDRTSKSSLLLSHFSAFWNAHSVIRAQILQRAIPHFDELLTLLKTRPHLPLEPEFERIATDRLNRLRELCEEYNARLVILVPPTPSSEDAVRQMIAVTHKVNVAALVPIDPTTLAASYYQTDALHLNSDGATLFTSALIADLRKNIVGILSLRHPANM